MIKHTLRRGSDVVRLKVRRQDRGMEASVQINDGPDVPLQRVLSAKWLGDSVVEIELDGRVLQAPVVRDGDTRWVCWEGRVFELSAASIRLTSARQSAHSDGLLIAPMPCLVVHVAARAGDQVAEGAELVVIEAMKTVQTLTAPFAGRISRVCVEERALVLEGAELVEVERAEPETSL